MLTQIIEAVNLNLEKLYYIDTTRYFPLQDITLLLQYKGATLGLAFLVCCVFGLYEILKPNWSVAVSQAINSLLKYYKTLYYFLVKQGSLETCPYFTENIHSQCHLYSIALIFSIWDKPHYRAGTFQNDMIKNLRNVAVPGTGIPLSLFARSKLLAYWMIFVGYPIICFMAALHSSKGSLTQFCAAFIEQLVAPHDWFSFWRLNCRLATAHSFASEWKDEYDMEDKRKFLQEAEKHNIAVTPCINIGEIVCKHRNEEGGLGYENYKNATIGGDWIVQEKLSNSPFLQTMLPSDAPLSTFRIISASRGGLLGLSKQGQVEIEDITALSCVWRAGRSKAKTDHSAILFNVNPNTGKNIKNINIKFMKRRKIILQLNMHTKDSNIFVSLQVKLKKELQMYIGINLAFPRYSVHPGHQITRSRTTQIRMIKSREE